MVGSVMSEFGRGYKSSVECRLRKTSNRQQPIEFAAIYRQPRDVVSLVPVHAGRL